MAEKTCPLLKAEEGAGRPCLGESCEWYITYPSGGGVCATVATARRLELVVDTLARTLAAAALGKGGKGGEKGREGGASQNPVWDDGAGS